MRALEKWQSARIVLDKDNAYTVFKIIGTSSTKSHVFLFYSKLYQIVI